MEYISKETKAPDPIGVILTTGLTVGMNLLLAPKQTGKQAIGESRNERVINTYVDKSRGVDTGSTRWLSEKINAIGPVQIEGINGTPIELNISNSSYDLAPFLLQSPFSGTIKINLICLQCSDATREHLYNPTNYTREKYFMFDLDAFKLAQASKGYEKTQITKLPKAKPAQQGPDAEKCKRLGLDPGTDDFNLCLSSQK